MFQDAVQVRASDLHIEPGENVLRVRQRVDGVLQEQKIDGRRVAGALVTRLKLMSGLDIAEKRLPQDGRFSLKVKDKSIDVRISTMPTQHGESVVMRLLDQSGSLMTLDKLGMSPAMLERFVELITRSAGMVLVTGPTGSGKTTTLYSALNHLNQPDTKIITVEDPVEYRLDRVNQVQVNPKIGARLRARAAHHAAPGPGRHPGRRNARPGDRRHRPARGDHRPPRVLDAAHDERGRDDPSSARHGRGRLHDRGRRARHRRAASRAPCLRQLRATDRADAAAARVAAVRRSIRRASRR